MMMMMRLGGDGLFAFVEFRTPEEASIALERLNGHQLKSYGALTTTNMLLTILGMHQE